VESQTLVQIVVGVIVSVILQRLKAVSWFPALSEASTRWTKVTVSALAAVASALAITVAWDGSAGVLTISGLTVENLANGVQAFLVSFLSQHVSYEMLLRRSVPQMLRPKSEKTRPPASVG
jgi:hypothetical protein